MCHARGAVLGLRGDLLQHRPKRVIGLRAAARHDAGPVQRALLAARDACADEVDTALAKLLLTTSGVLEVGVAAVDDDIALVQQRGEFLDDRIRRITRLHHDDQAARPFQGRYELFGRVRGHEAPFVAELLDQSVRLRCRAVVHRDRVAVAGEVARQVAAHHREPGDADLRSAAHLSAPAMCRRWWRTGPREAAARPGCRDAQYGYGAAGRPVQRMRMGVGMRLRWRRSGSGSGKAKGRGPGPASGRRPPTLDTSSAAGQH